MATYCVFGNESRPKNLFSKFKSNSNPNQHFRLRVVLNPEAVLLPAEQRFLLSSALVLVNLETEDVSFWRGLHVQTSRPVTKGNMNGLIVIDMRLKQTGMKLLIFTMMA